MSDPFDCQEFHELMMDYRAHPTGNGPYELVQDYIRRQLSMRLALAEADAKRLDAIDACWANGIHIEVCATGSFSGTNLKKIVTVFYGDDTHIAETVRDALDLLNAALAGKGTEK